MIANFEIFTALPDEARHGSKISQLRTFITSNGVRTSTWGYRPHRRLPSLLADIENGKNILYAADGAVVCQTSVAVVDVIHECEDGTVLQLSETQRTYGMSTIQPRKPNGHTLKKRLMPAELPATAAERAIVSCLGTDYQSLYGVGSVKEAKAYNGFPGVQHVAELFGFIALLDDTDFQPDGYQKNQDDYLGSYRWSPLGTV